MIEIREAIKNQAAEIADLIMIAMTDECCLYFCGEGHGLDDFRKMMISLVEADVSQYSYKNTLVAMDGKKVVGVAVSYDGGLLRKLVSWLTRTIQGARLSIPPSASAMWTINNGEVIR